MITVGDEDVPYGFEGKTVIFTRGEDGDVSYAYKGGSKLEGEDLKGIKKAFAVGSKKDKDDPTGTEIFAPKKPGGVGESWEAEIGVMARSLGAKDGLKIDEEASKAKFTLTSVEKRGDVEFGKISGTMELAVVEMGPLKLETAIPFKLTFDLNGCIAQKQL